MLSSRTMNCHHSWQSIQLVMPGNNFIQGNKISWSLILFCLPYMNRYWLSKPNHFFSALWIKHYTLHIHTLPFTFGWVTDSTNQLSVKHPQDPSLQTCTLGGKNEHLINKYLLANALTFTKAGHICMKTLK